MASSINACAGVVYVPSHGSRSREAARLNYSSLKSPSFVVPALRPFRPAAPAPLPPARLATFPLIQAAWTRRASGEPKKNKKSWGQRVDKYMKPFILDINISRRYLHAKVVHRVTGKSVAVATTNARDLRFSLPSLVDEKACKVIANLLAERAKAADVFAVLYEPRRNEKLEGKLALILNTFLANDIALLKG
ncbi:hypothetical protein GOP47_0020228 [Adiantum capillus-veneris]|uniref:Uncharacterized protein n=1 Tax=Adiantum capillus-veneris TaxID=13818 RepID=A0A9D4UCK4_ADICA|nr:hypothetical protein GOP47_0020228 [Adiantum capillus-veneris]